MKKVKKEFQCQSKWNNVYGKANLLKMKEKPEQFLIDKNDIGKLLKIKHDLVKAMLKGNASSNELKNLKILELGSGRGEFSILLTKMGGDVTGIDIGIDLVDLSKQTAKLNKVICDFIVGSIDQLPFDDCTFDFVVGNAILHHLPEKGIKDTLSEAYRVLKHGGQALFTEPLENSKLFDFIQNLIPVGKGTPQNRPSILQHKEWKKYLQEADDRALTNKELVSAKGEFDSISFTYYGFLSRLVRLFRNVRFRKLLSKIDVLLTHRFSPIKKLSQSGLVIYKKDVK